MVIAVTIKGPIESFLEGLERSVLFLLPGTASAVENAIPTHVEEVFTHVVPSGIEQAEGMILLAVAHHAANIDQMGIVSGEYATAPKGTGSYDGADAGPVVRSHGIVVGSAWQAVPYHGNQILRNFCKVYSCLLT